MHVHTHTHTNIPTSEHSCLSTYTYVTCSHKMVDKSHFGTTEIFVYSERRENADYCGEKMIVVSAKRKKLWRVKVSGGESSHFEKNLFKVVQHTRVMLI